MSLNWIVNRLREPSSWRGIVWIVTATGITLSPELWEHITAVGMAVAGLTGVILREEPSRTIVDVHLPPPIDLIAESATVRADGGLRRRAGDSPPDPDRLPQRPVRPVDYPVPRSNTSEAADSDFPGWGS